MHMNPLPATAFDGAFGTLLRGIAETPGPCSLVAQTVARVVPRFSKTAMAESGPLGALAKSGLEGSVGWNMAAKTLVYGGGILDGTAKYISGPGPQQMVQVATG